MERFLNAMSIMFWTVVILFTILTGLWGVCEWASQKRGAAQFRAARQAIRARRQRLGR